MWTLPSFQYLSHRNQFSWILILQLIDVGAHMRIWIFDKIIIYVSLMCKWLMTESAHPIWKCVFLNFFFRDKSSSFFTFFFLISSLSSSSPWRTCCQSLFNAAYFVTKSEKIWFSCSPGFVFWFKDNNERLTFNLTFLTTFFIRSILFWVKNALKLKIIAEKIIGHLKLN